MVKAANVGIDAIKFQKRTIDQVYSQEFLDGPRKDLLEDYFAQYVYIY